MKVNELRELSDDQLTEKLGELSEEGFRLRFRSSTEAITSPIRFRTIRRDVARIKTILGERRRSTAGQAKG